jgi:hypothetical protein
MLPLNETQELQKIALQARTEAATKEGAELTDSDRRQLMTQIIRQRVDQSNLSVNVIGAGAESVVVDNPYNANEVIAIEYDNNGRPLLNAPIMYHTHKLLSHLFPHNFPDLSRVTSQTIPITNRQKIISGDHEIGYPMKDCLQKVKEFGLPIELDNHPDNFATSVNGGQYYMDIINFDDYKWDKIQTTKITAYIRQQQYPPQEQHVILESMNRLRVLGLAKNLLYELTINAESPTDILNILQDQLGKFSDAKMLVSEAKRILIAIEKHYRSTNQQQYLLIEQFLNQWQTPE